MTFIILFWITYPTRWLGALSKRDCCYPPNKNGTIFAFSFFTHSKSTQAGDGIWPNLCAFGNLLRNYTHVSTVKKNYYIEGCNSIILPIHCYVLCIQSEVAK